MRQRKSMIRHKTTVGRGKRGRKMRKKRYFNSGSKFSQQGNKENIVT